MFQKAHKIKQFTYRKTDNVELGNELHGDNLRVYLTVKGA